MTVSRHTAGYHRKTKTQPARDRPACAQEASPVWDGGVTARVERECAEQGIPVAIDDPVTIAKIITLVRAGRASKSATKAARSARRDRPSASAKGQ